MSDVKLQRKTRRIEITLGTASSSATTIRTDDMAGGILFTGTVSTNAATLRVFGSPSETGSFSRVYAADGQPADITLSPSATDGRAYSLPDAAFAVPYIRIVSGETASSGVQATVVFKS